MDSGADDYIAKPFNKHELNVRIKAGRRIIELEQQLISTRNLLEFLAILPGCSEDDASRVAERIRTVVSSEEINVPDGALTVTISVGVVVGDPHDVLSKVFIQTADEALYTAKESGRNCVEMTVF